MQISVDIYFVIQGKKGEKIFLNITNVTHLLCEFNYYLFIFQIKQLGNNNVAGSNPVKKPKEPEPEATFSLRQLLQTSVLEKSQNAKIPGNLTKFQSFSLNNHRTVEAVSEAFEENVSNIEKFQCSKCDSSFNSWPEVALHLLQESGTFAKHLSKSLDQSLVIFTTDAKITSLISVVRCRKCKFYLPTSSETQFANVLSHVEACAEKSADATADQACLTCGNHVTQQHTRESCLRTLKEKLAIFCNPCLVCKQNTTKMAVKNDCVLHTRQKGGKFEKCLAVISQTFQDGETIEEMIVASKQRKNCKKRRNFY